MAGVATKHIDLRSDTVTVPTPEMREAMYRAEVGDDVYGEDPTVNRLEELAAAKVGKEAALFVPTGTMGNQLSAMTHVGRGDEIVLDAEAHIYYYEVAGLAVLSSAQVRAVPSKKGVMAPEDVEAAIRGRNIHYPRTALICLENTHNRAGGTVVPLENMRAIRAVADKYGIPIHLDGARIFNAAVALGVEAREIARYADSVMFCLSKGLGAPVGSIVAGTRAYIDRARKNRKTLGGGMRQAGVIAAAGIVALEKMIDRLAEDHANARLIAERLRGVPGLAVDMETVQTNMVGVSVAEGYPDAPAVSAGFLANGLKANATGPRRIRLVTHKDVSSEDCRQAVEIIRRVMASAA